jgi:hypothetical protein
MMYFIDQLIFSYIKLSVIHRYMFYNLQAFDEGSMFMIVLILKLLPLFTVLITIVNICNRVNFAAEVWTVFCLNTERFFIQRDPRPF